jgi:hypothetical protein
VGFRVLAAGNEPDFRTISDFRKLHLAALQGLFDQVLRITLQAGTMKLGRVVLDGSKVKANASKHKAMSYGRMQEDEKRLKEEVKRLLGHLSRKLCLTRSNSLPGFQHRELDMWETERKF